MFKIGGKDYILNESHMLDIPYGEDIFDIQYPSREKSQKTNQSRIMFPELNNMFGLGNLFGENTIYDFYLNLKHNFSLK